MKKPVGMAGIGLLAALILATALSGCSWAGDVLPAHELELPRDKAPGVSVGDNLPRSLAISYDLPTETGNEVGVIAREHEIWYIDLGTLQVIRRNLYDPNEWPCISRDGRYIAVLSQFESRRTNTIMKNIRVEDWTGELLWEMPAKIRSKFEPTPTGGLIAYPSSRPGFSSDPGWGRKKVVPEYRRHDLLVYDREGNLILDGVDYDKIRWGGHGFVSPDGGYLVFVCDVIPPEDAAGLSRHLEDRGCLILYDIERGAELWRHYFDGIMLPTVAVSPQAERILCFAGLGDSPNRRLYNTMFLFDRRGTLLTERQMVPPGRHFVPDSPVVSTDGRLCAFTDNPQSNGHLIRMDDGSTVWEFAKPPEARGMTCLGVTNAGNALLLAIYKRGDVYERELLVVSGDGRALHKLTGGRIKSGGVIPASGILLDGTSVWAIQGRGLYVYSLDSNTRVDGGESR